MENKHKVFKPYDRVLTRSQFVSAGVWMADLYSHYSNGKHYIMGMSQIDDPNIIPYEGNEHLLGTTDEMDEEVRLEEGEKIICSDFIERMNSGKGSLEDFERVVNNRFYSKTDFNGYSYAIRFSDFNPNDMEETKKHILCVKEGKIIKYKDGK